MDKLQKATKVLGILPRNSVLKLAAQIKKSSPKQLCHYCKNNAMAKEELLANHICKEGDCKNEN